MWDVTLKQRVFLDSLGISTHTSRVGCDYASETQRQAETISTHTSRVGCDDFYTFLKTGTLNFYSHIPCGMWLKGNGILSAVKDFYSHIPCGMWPERAGSVGNSCNFYSHIPCGMWRSSSVIPSALEIFLLTHPVWDVTPFNRVLVNQIKFLLTHPVWDVTVYGDARVCGNAISTHTSRVGCDGRHDAWRQDIIISTHTSRVGCDFHQMILQIRQNTFLLTHPVWDVTEWSRRKSRSLSISTHTSRVGCDSEWRWKIFGLFNFYSHIPCGMWLHSLFPA